jgi:serine/threonine-protein kinase
MSDTIDDPIDQYAFSLLDAYLQDLHAGRRPDRERFLAEHPELSDALQCLEAIDSLAPDATEDLGNPGEPRIHSALTEIRTGSDSGQENSSHAAPLPQATTDFGDYQLLAEIGRGGMGVVYKARQKTLDRLVAVKMILASHLASDDQVHRFYAEARAAAKLQHPNIVGIHEIGHLHGQHYFVMEHVEGRSLADVLAAGPMDPEAAADCAAKIARAVHHLHQQGIVHRDLKPSNILIDARGEPHVTDFGLAKTLIGDSQLTHTGAIVGTPSYMAPEQAAGRGAEVGPHSDVYSLGALLYDMLTGRPPFREATPLDTLVQVLEAEPRLPSQINPRVPRDLEMICLRCIEKLAQNRYPSAAALADDLERFLKRESVDARPPGFVQRVRRWSRREPALSSRLGVLALCLVILQINFWMTQETPDAIDPRVHGQVMIVLALWAAASLVCQRGMSHERSAEPARYAWAATDAIMLTLILWLTDNVQSPVVVGFPALIATSGLWFRERLVWFMTGICSLGYVALLVDWTRRGQDLDEPLFRHIILLVLLIGLGFVVAYQVRRIRALSRYYEHRRLP